MKKQAIEAVRDAILAEPDMYDQNEYYGSSINPCETACCIAGWASWYLGKNVFNEAVRHGGFIENLQKAFGIDYPTTSALVTADGSTWPAPYSHQFRAANTSAEKASVAAAMLDYLIACGGKF